jgi:hypothetical protein
MSTERPVTEEEALKILWAQKTITMDKPRWIFARTVGYQKASEWNGRHPVEENSVERMLVPGTRVAVPMLSRFGDVGFRARRLNPATDSYDGYDGRTAPENLSNWTVVEP